MDMTKIDELCIQTIRFLAMDGAGPSQCPHPMGLAVHHREPKEAFPALAGWEFGPATQLRRENRSTSTKNRAST